MSLASALAGPTAAYHRGQLWALVALRMLIGWHLLYEGIAKIQNPYWTAAGYLSESQGPFAGWFVWMAAEPGRLALVDALNQWGLVLIGLCLMLGLVTRAATLAGIALLSLYYLALPPIVGGTSSVPMEGSYLLVNKTLIETAALVVLLLFPTGRHVGLDSVLFREGRRR